VLDPTRHLMLIGDVRKGGAEAVFNVEAGVALRKSVGFKLGELRRAQAFGGCPPPGYRR
jgi:hypothetical protein